MSDDPDGYHTYLLRIWRAQVRGRWQWRASLENPYTGERLAFATLDELSRYLKSRPVLPVSPLDEALETPPPPSRY